MTNTLKTVLKLLLLITMVVEPVLLSYAMAGGTYPHGGAAVMEKGCNSVSMSHDMDMDDDESSGHRTPGDGYSTGHDNCCSTPACGMAVLPIFFIPAIERHSQHFASFDLFWDGVILSSEAKPPRSLRG